MRNRKKLVAALTSPRTVTTTGKKRKDQVTVMPMNPKTNLLLLGTHNPFPAHSGVELFV